MIYYMEKEMRKRHPQKSEIGCRGANMDVIKTTGLTKYYGKTKGIVDLDLSVAQGDFFGFIGPNGAGKSTTIRTLLGLIRPSGGRAWVLGKDIQNEKEEILKNVGYLPSESVFYRGMRVLDVLRFSAQLRKMNCEKQAEQLCKRLDLDTTRKAGELSFGNRKKLAIICALQHDPALLILDEPTSGLDPLMQREFFDILKERNHKGVSVFLSSHVLSEIQRNCQKAAIIREGGLIACDSVEALGKTSAKRVTVQGKADVAQLLGVKELSRQNGGFSFLYSGEMGALLSALSKGYVQDVSISDLNLEEIFMHYYTSGGETK